MIHNIQVIGVSWKEYKQEDIEKITLREEHIHDALKELTKDYDVEEAAYLRTCNRTELIIASSDIKLHQELRSAWGKILNKYGIEYALDKKMRAWIGEGAFEHLFMVASGLESASIGENEILAQLKEARDYAQKINTFGPNLELLFNESFKVAAKVKLNTKISHGQSSLSEIAVKEILNLQKINPELRVGLIGRSPMIESALKSLQEKNLNLTIFNRNLEKIEPIVKKYKLKSYSLNTLKCGAHSLDVIMTSTKSNDFLFNKNEISKIFYDSKSPTVIDLASPADLDKEICAHLAINYISLDHIIDIAKLTHLNRAGEKSSAREIIDFSLFELHQKISDIRFNSLYSAIQKRYQHTANEGIKKLVKKSIPGLNNNAINELDIWCQAMAKRFAHIPTLGLRGLLHNGPEGSVEAFIKGLDEKFQSELEEALNTKESTL
jgi:glutamyl-tRNA reductase